MGTMTRWRQCGTGSQGTFTAPMSQGLLPQTGECRGVAPEATIIAYRALGPGGMGTTEQVVAAIEQAIKDKWMFKSISGNNVNGPDLPIKCWR